MQMLAVATPVPSEAMLLAVTGLYYGAFILFPCSPLKATAPKDPSCNARTGGMIFRVKANDNVTERRWFSHLIMLPRRPLLSVVWVVQAVSQRCLRWCLGRHREE